MKSLTLSKILLDFVDGCLEIMGKIAFSIGGDLPFHQGQDFLVTEVLGGFIISIGLVDEFPNKLNGFAVDRGVLKALEIL